MKLPLGAAIAGLLLIVGGAVEAREAATGWDRIAVLGGASLVGGDRDFDQVQIVVGYRLPDWPREAIQLRLEGLAGTFRADGGQSGNFIGAGFELSYQPRDSALTWSFGSAATGVSRHEFDTVDLGSDIQFISHLGVRTEIGERVGLAARIQHMSNAGIESPNPGLDTAVIGVDWRL